MEIIAEIVIQVLVWVLQLLCELVIQMAFGAIAELIGHAVKKAFHLLRPLQPSASVVGHLFLGATAGGLSLWLSPELFIKVPWLRVANLALTPLAAGLIMQAIGAWRARRQKEVLRLESFAYGFSFAFAMAVIRFVFGE